jgi:N-acetylglutamate synthase-like GNAT family acetyltransferase
MIRTANRFDVPQILDMLRHYRDAGIVAGVKDVINEETPLKIMTHILAGGGLALVSEKDNKLTGMLLALKTPLLWDMEKFVMNEIAYWVEPHDRGTTSGYRLIQEYTELCDVMVDMKQITRYTITQLEGQSLDYGRFGFKPIEHTWSS